MSYLSPQDFEEAASAGEFDAAFFGWLRDIPDPDPSALLHSSQIEGGQNFAHYQNAKVDTWLEEAVATSDRDLRKALYAKIHDRIYEKSYLLPISTWPSTRCPPSGARWIRTACGTFASSRRAPSGRAGTGESWPIGCGGLLYVLVGCRTCLQSRQRGVASTYAVFDTPTICTDS